MWTKDSLLDLIHSKLGDYKFILVSNREPYVHRRTPNGIEVEQPASGLTVASIRSCALAAEPGLRMGAAAQNAKRLMRRIESGSRLKTRTIRCVVFG
jgi:hypothetical protein